SGLFGRQANFRSTESLCLFALLRPAQLDGAAAFDRHRIHGGTNVRFAPILLQKSQKARRLIPRQRTKQATIADQRGFKRAARIVCEFSAWRRGPPHHHSIAAPTGARIWVPPRKKTFATISALFGCKRSS